jgi:hypothetical protein
VVTKPPGEASEETGELVLPEEPEPPKRRRFWRRAVDAGQADPWKA